MQANVPELAAQRTAETLVSADARGINSHGVIRLARYIDCMKSGGIIPDAEIKIMMKAPHSSVPVPPEVWAFLQRMK